MTDQELTYVGKRLPIRDAALKVTGQLRYTADMKLPRMLHAKVLWSPIAHGRIKSIDTSRAEALPGVRAVLTHKNAPGILFGSAMRFVDHEVVETEHLFDDTVRFVGDRVAAVVAEDLDTARKAVQLIDVEYEELPAVFDPEEAIKEGAPAIHPGGNIVDTVTGEAGNVEEGFTESDLIFEDRYTVPTVHPGFLEPYVSIGDYDAQGKLTIWSPTQTSYSVRVLVAKLTQLPISKVRIIRPAIGGGFGGKWDPVIEPLVGVLAKTVGCPVKLEMTYRETMISGRTRHAAVLYLKTGVKRDGTIVAQDIRIISNTGAYATSALNWAYAVRHKVFKLYKTKHMRFVCLPTYTNTHISGAMRGYGSPQFCFAQQVQFNKIAKALNLDMVEMELKNLVEPDDLDSRFGEPIGNPRPIDCVVRGAAAFNWSQRRKSEDNGRYKRGVGMAVCTHGNGLHGVHRDFTALMLKMNEDGGVTLFTGTHDMGTGLVTVETQIVGEILGIDPRNIECVEADTETTLWNLGDYASRGCYVSGGAAVKVAESLKREILKEASILLEIPSEELALKDGQVYSTRNPDRRAPLSDVVISAHKVNQREIACVESHAAPAGPASYGAHFAEVEVDTETGKVRVLDYVAVQDVGKAINPMFVEGQIEGAIQMGIGYALTEELVLDEKGKVRNSNLKKYHMIRANEMPEKTKVLFVEEGEGGGPFGAKGVGEAPTIPVAPAIVNAVCNALGVEFHDLPLKPERILRAVK